jgi:SAM-dependent methyltransferase
MHNAFRKYVPRPVRLKIRRVVYAPLDMIDRIRGGGELRPPRSMMNVASSDFKESGQKYLELFKRLGDLKPGDRVLDVGSGIGHISVAIAEYLDASGSYDGFDVVKQGVDWCSDHITARYPNVRFRHVDIFNSEYNPGGRIAPSEFEFPYDDASFDFVLLTSVFTHMHLPDVARYLSEIARVLKPGGRCFATYFLLGVPGAPSSGGGLARFYEADGPSLTIDAKHPEKALAHPLGAIHDALKSAGLEPIGAVQIGGWRGTEDLLGAQDILVAVRR